MALCMTFRCRLQGLTVRKTISIQPVRFRWKPPDPDEIILPSYAERLAQWNSRYEAPASQGINIGFYYSNSEDSSKKLDLLKKWSVKRKQLEQASRRKTLTVDLSAVKEEWFTECMPEHVCKIATHYGIYRDMFDGAHFHPVLPLNVSFDYDEEFVTPVFNGNVLPAAEASVKPFVSYEAKEDSLWTLVMSSPDGNLQNDSRELLHWFVGNIPGSSIDKGDVICDYLQPFPPKGVGFLRYVFVLYKQKQVLDFKEWKRSAGCLSLRERSFSSLDFYRQNEDNLTPAGLSFFQSEWDSSVTSVFHHVLDMKEPVFEFLHPPFYRPEQVDFPHKKPFNIYLDDYRDVKDIQEEVLKEKLKHADISKPSSRLQFPNAEAVPTKPSWLNLKIQSMQLGKQQWKDLIDEKD